MSASPSKADMLRLGSDVGEVPIADMSVVCQEPGATIGRSGMICKKGIDCEVRGRRILVGGVPLKEVLHDYDFDSFSRRTKRSNQA